METKTFFQKYRVQILFFLIMAFAAAVRLVFFGSHPAGLNQDEASIGYEAWSVLHYGIDRNGLSVPVHFIAWGSGQNALYAYLSMPFIALFGLNVVTTRIVNLIFSLVSVAVIYFLISKFKGRKTAFIAMALTAAAPWNIMLARWGLESNLFPAMFLLSIWTLTLALEKRKFLYLSAFLFAMTMYSYGSSYLVITLFAVAAYIFFIVKKLIPIKNLLISAGIFIVFSLPIYLFMLINLLNLETIHIGFFTIPHTYGGRLADQGGAEFSNIINNIYSHLVIQSDGAVRNSLPFYGCFYVISLPFTVYGLVKTVSKVFKEKSVFDFLIFDSFICSLLLFAYYKAPNINRVNSIYLPLIIFTAYGLSELFKSKKQIICAALAYAICFCGFSIQYFGEEYRNNIATEFYSSFGEAVKKADDISKNKSDIYVTANVNMPYIYALFYTETPPKDFVNTVKYTNPGSQFQQVESFKNFKFSHNYITSKAKGVYVIDNSDVQTIKKYTKEIYPYEKYSVAVIR